MAQPVIHARIKLADTTSLEDAATIGMTFEITGSAQSVDWTSDPFLNAIQTFFNGTQGPGQTNAVNSYISPHVSRGVNGVWIDYYDVTQHLDGKNIGSPVYSNAFQLGGGSGTALPSELAIACGFRSEYGGDAERSGTMRPAARDRGRFYIGPLSNAALGNGSAVYNGAVQDLYGALKNLCKTWNPGAANQMNLVVWSRKGQKVSTAKYVYVDEGFAIQRRRGDTTETRKHSWSAIS